MLVLLQAFMSKLCDLQINFSETCLSFEFFVLISQVLYLLVGLARFLFVMLGFGFELFDFHVLIVIFLLVELI